jgi:thymidine phosphorylase
VKSIDAYSLDRLFEELTTKGTAYDFDVGIWLHRLPGERCESGDPLFTIFYRTAKHDEEKMEQLARRLNKGITYDD